MVGYPIETFLMEMKITKSDRKTILTNLKIVDYDSLMANKEAIQQSHILHHVAPITQLMLIQLIEYVENPRMRLTNRDPNQILRNFKSNDLMNTIMQGRELHKDLARSPSSEGPAKGGDQTISLVSMEPQGFQPSDTQTDIDEISLLPQGSGDKFNQDESLVDSIEFQGKIFRKNQCYKYLAPESKTPVVVGIKAFSSDGTKAYCVLVVSISETFLGQTCTGDEAEILKRVVKRRLHNDFVQVRRQGQQEPISLANLVEVNHDSSVPSNIPALIYEPQESGSRRSLGYVYDTGQASRVGPRGTINVVDFFCGAGIMHQGYKSRGFTTLKAVDLDRDAITTFKHNNPECANNVEQICVNEYLKIYRRKKDQVVHLLHVSSPCQGFSGANRGAIDNKGNNELSLSFVEGLKKTGALVGVFENVTGIWKTTGIQYLRKIFLGLLENGYQFRTMILRASDYGDPQKRDRFFIFASKSFIPLPRRPPATHMDPKLMHLGNGFGLAPWATVGDCLELLNSMMLKGCLRFPNMNDVKTTECEPGQHDSVQLEIDEPAPTLRASGPPVFHYDRNTVRVVTVREYAALFSLPHTYEITGRLSKAYTQIGNGVPCNLARAIAGVVEEVLRFEYRGEANADVAMYSPKPRYGPAFNGTKTELIDLTNSEVVDLVDSLSDHEEEKNLEQITADITHNGKPVKAIKNSSFPRDVPIDLNDVDADEMETEELAEQKIEKDVSSLNDETIKRHEGTQISASLKSQADDHSPSHQSEMETESPEASMDILELDFLPLFDESDFGDQGATLEKAVEENETETSLPPFVKDVEVGEKNQHHQTCNDTDQNLSVINSHESGEDIPMGKEYGESGEIYI